MNHISSTKNQHIKDLIFLQEKARQRKETQTFPIEGIKEISLAIAANYTMECLFFCEPIVPKEFLEKYLSFFPKTYSISTEVFEKIAYRQSTGGVIALAKIPNIKLEKIQLRKKPIILILESVEKPGNLGALLRTADAAKIDAVLICEPQTDFFNPNVIRSSVGCVFTNQIAAQSKENILEWLKKNKIKIFATSLESAKFYHLTDFTQASAIVMGTEATGISDFWVKNADATIKIPMLGQIDSMNVSNAAAIVIYEALRQRNFKY